MISDSLRNIITSLIFHEIGFQPGVAVIEAWVGPELAASNSRSEGFVIAQWMLDIALGDPEPTLFMAFLKKVNRGKLIAEINTLQASLEADPSQWATQVDDPIVLSEGQPFVDRHNFKELLRSLSPDAGPSCLVVRGDSGSGRTTLLHYCKRLTEQGTSTLRLAVAEVNDTIVHDLPLDILAEDAGFALSTDQNRFPRFHEDPHRFARNLAAWLVDWTPAPPDGVVPLLVLDGFDNDDLPDPAHTFVRELAQRLVRADPPFRLVLLGYPEEVLTEAEVLFEVCALEKVDADQLVDWLERRYPQLSDGQRESVAEAVIEAIPESGRSRMSLLSKHLRRQTRGLVDG